MEATGTQVRRRRHVWIAGLIFCGLLALCGAGWWSVQAPAGSLLRHAKHLAVGTDSYYWLSDHRFVSKHYTPTSMQAVLHDLATGTATPLQGALPHPPEVVPVESAIYSSSLASSPTSLEVEMWTRASVRQALDRSPALRLLGSHRSLKRRTSGLLIGQRSPQILPVTLKPDSTFKITYPLSYVTSTMITPSPDGKCWAVFIAGWQPSPLPAILHPLFPFWGEKPFVAVYTGRFESNRAHLLGRLILPGAARKSDTYRWSPVTDSQPFGALQWMPDSKHLSFAYKGALWAVPAE